MESQYVSIFYALDLRNVFGLAVTSTLEIKKYDFNTKNSYENIAKKKKEEVLSIIK